MDFHASMNPLGSLLTQKDRRWPIFFYDRGNSSVRNILYHKKMLRKDAQLAEKKYVLWTPLAREEFASKLFVYGLDI